MTVSDPLHSLQKNFEICDYSLEGARLQPRRTWFSKSYGRARRQCPFKTPTRASFSAAHVKLPPSTKT